MQGFALKMDREVLADTLLANTFILGYNGNKAFRLVFHQKPQRPVTPGEDQRFNSDEDYWKLEDIALELRAAVRVGDSGTWVEPPLSTFEAAVSQFAEFSREFEKGVCVRRNGACYLKSWAKLPLYRDGSFDAFKEAVDNLLGFEAAARSL